MEQDTLCDRVALVLAYALLVAALLGVFSCVATTSDLDRIHTRIEAVESAVESGDCAEIKAALADTKAEVASVAREVESRPGVWSRFALEIILASVGVAVPAAVGATNVVRNRARIKRGERVDIPKPKAS